MRTWIPTRSGALAVGIVLLLASHAGAQLPQKLVLIVHGGPESYPGNSDFDADVRGILYAAPTMQVEAYTEYLENEEFSEIASSSLKEYIRLKYLNRKRPDLVIVNTAPALEFVLASRDELFPGAPVLFVSNTIPPDVTERKVHGVTGIVRDPSFVETVELALQIHPNTKRLHVIAYAPALQGFEDRARATLAQFSKRLEVTWGNEPTLPEMLAALRKLPPGTIVLANRYSPIGNGRVMYPGESIPALSEAAPAPLYATLDTYIGQGVIGGMMRNNTETAHRLGTLAVRILEGASADSIPIEPASVRPLFDWRQLQRWNIDESRLPPGSEIRFREQSVWQLYGWYIAGTLAVVIAQLLLIGGLLWQTARLRGAGHTIRAREAALSISYARIRHLAGRLLSAQDEVRAEIARDLHDDVCQKLALVATGVKSLKSGTGELQNPRTQEAFDDLERNTRVTFDGIRQMSHELHPATLRLLGLASALRSHCADLARHQGTRVEFSSDDLGVLHPEVAVCFFRIAQEAIRNGATHGGATRMTVTLTRSDNQLEMVVTDQGRGFDVDAVRRAGGGIGLISMEERAHTIHASVAITSEIGRGTSVRVFGPAEPTLGQVAQAAS